MSQNPYQPPQSSIAPTKPRSLAWKDLAVAISFLGTLFLVSLVIPYVQFIAVLFLAVIVASVLIGRRWGFIWGVVSFAMFYGLIELSLRPGGPLYNPDPMGLVPRGDGDRLYF